MLCKTYTLMLLSVVKIKSNVRLPIHRPRQPFPRENGVLLDTMLGIQFNNENVHLRDRIAGI